MSVTSTQADNFEKLVDEWAEADKECSRLYMLWDKACQRREHLARAKNKSWLEMNESRGSAFSNGE